MKIGNLRQQLDVEPFTLSCVIFVLIGHSLVLGIRQGLIFPRLNYIHLKANDQLRIINQKIFVKSIKKNVDKNL